MPLSDFMCEVHCKHVQPPDRVIWGFFWSGAGRRALHWRNCSSDPPIPHWIFTSSFTYVHAPPYRKLQQTCTWEAGNRNSLPQISLPHSKQNTASAAFTRATALWQKHPFPFHLLSVITQLRAAFIISGSYEKLS